MAGAEEGGGVGHMLDHLHVQHHVEGFAAGRDRLGRGDAVVDGEALAFGVDLRDGDVARGGVGADHGRAEPRHGFGQEPAAAADVEDAQPGRRGGQTQVAVDGGRTYAPGRS